MDTCMICDGARVIDLAINYQVRMDMLSTVPDQIPPSSKRYPCPECQPVFYRHDLIDCHSAEPHREEFADEKGYQTSINNHIARRIGQVALSRDTILFEQGDTMGMGYRYRIGTLFVVKPTAQGFKK